MSQCGIDSVLRYETEVRGLPPLVLIASVAGVLLAALPVLALGAVLYASGAAADLAFNRRK